MDGCNINLLRMTVALTADQQVTVCEHLHREMVNGNWADMDDLQWGVEHNDLITVFLAFGFQPSTPRTSDKTITDVSYHGKAAEAVWLWQRIAKALPELTGFLDWADDAGNRFRWVFKDGVFEEIYPRLVWGSHV